MRNQTRKIYENYTTQIAHLNGISDASKSFTVTPSVEQKLEERIQEQADFLQKINVVPVTEISGQVIDMGMSGPIAGRTDTTNADRATRNNMDLAGRTYHCRQTNFDTHVSYSQLDAWAKFPNFQDMMRNQVVKQIARDRLMIGFNGTNVAATTDIAANPLLQDVNIGWLQKLRDDKPSHAVSGVKVGKGSGSDFKNFDSLIYDATQNGLDPVYANDPDIVVIAGSSIVADKYLALLEGHDAPTEKAALATLMSNKTMGSKKTYVVPFFPADTILLTSLKNLSIYVQADKRRRSIVDNAKRDRIEDYNSSNEDYIIQDLKGAYLIEGILQWDGASWA